MGIGARRRFGLAVGGGLVPGSGGKRIGRGHTSGLPAIGRGLIELELRDGLGSREVEGRGLIELKFGLGRTPGGRHRGRPMRQGGRSRWRRMRSTVEGGVMPARAGAFRSEVWHTSWHTKHK